MATHDTKPERTYGQWCPIAAGLDVVGDRWVLLICRELLIADQRFTDLRRALPGLAPNLLTERLRALQSAGLVDTVDLPPPAARTVYRLTQEGRTITPVLRAMARFGVQRLEGEPSTAFSAARAAHSLLLPWRKRVSADLRVRLVLHTATGHTDAADVVLKGTTSVVTGPEGEADVTITTDAASLARSRRHPSPGLVAEVSGTDDARQMALHVLDLDVQERR